jgi:hypothetical protein
MIKILTLADWDELSSAIKALPYHRIAQTRQSISEAGYLQYTRTILELSNSTVYGYYNEANELSSMISVVNFSYMPEYAVYNWRNLKPDFIYDPANNGWADLFNRLLEDQESKELYTFYMMRTADISRLQFKKYHDTYMKTVPKFLNYERTVEEVVPAGQSTKWKLFDAELYHQKQISYKTMVLRFTCRQNCRNIVSPELQKLLIMQGDEK